MPESLIRSVLLFISRIYNAKESEIKHHIRQAFEELARSLRQAGAVQISAWVLARTLPH
jgi:hypothetical protein